MSEAIIDSNETLSEFQQSYFKIEKIAQNGSILRYSSKPIYILDINVQNLDEYKYNYTKIISNILNFENNTIPSNIQKSIDMKFKTGKYLTQGYTSFNDIKIISSKAHIIHGIIAMAKNENYVYISSVVNQETLIKNQFIVDDWLYLNDSDEEQDDIRKYIEYKTYKILNDQTA